MKTQISRDSFRREARYSGVFQQMGRMLTDADWNELSTIDRERLADALYDLVGSGTPRGRGIVRSETIGSETVYSLRWGHVYVDGIGAQVRPDPDATLDDPAGAALELAHQADFPLAPLPPGDHRLYLDVWDRTVVALEDPDLLDPGLNGADTCTRTQTMAQVKWCETDVEPEDAATNPSIGQALLTLEVRQGSTEPDPCDPCSDELALQDETANSLFRVEIHDVLYDAAGAPEQMTLKWSRENGAEQYAIDALPTGFSGNDWAFEFFHGPTEQLASEKHLGIHLAPGFAAVRGELSDGYSDPVPAGYSLVRRWDGFCTLVKVGGSWTLAGGPNSGADRGVAISTASAATAHGHLGEGATIVLQLENLVLTLELADHPLLAGDFWWAVVRSAVHGPGDALDMSSLPEGVRHHYMWLGDVIGEVFTPADTAQCKRLEFSPLTDLRAGDVCYDNTACDLAQVDTVQDAIDYLCQERDLRHHNRHLHGWGIVCGLILECGPDTIPAEDLGDEIEGELLAPRRQLRLTDGYALDCMGNDLVVKTEKLPGQEPGYVLDLIAAIEERDTGENDPLLIEGSGTVCLQLDGVTDGVPDIGITPYTEEAFSVASLLDGTLWMDFYQDCLVDLIEAVTGELQFLNADELAEADAESDAEVSLQRRKYTSLLNLGIQLINPGNGAYVHLSYREHLILRDFYLQLRALLQSSTFCALFQDDNFPDYPFEDRSATTFFGKNLHTRCKLHPDGRTLYTYGGTDNRINVYDTSDGELVEVVEMPSTEGAEVVALAFSPKGDLLYAAAHLRGLDSLLGSARIDGPDHKWDGMTVLCDLLITEMEVAAKDPELVYAIGRGQGLFYLRPQVLADANEKPRPEPIYAFNAFGHLRIDGDLAFATSLADETLDPDRYDQVVALQLALNEDAGDNQDPTFSRDLRDRRGNPVSGADDIALRPASLDRPLLYVVVDGQGESADKLLLSYAFGAEGFGDGPSTELAIEDTRVALEYHASDDHLLLGLEDGYRLQRVLAGGASTAILRIPVQIQPLDLAIDDESGRVYVLNYLSNSITALPATELSVSDGYLNDLADYRIAILEAFYSLLGGVLQYLKDCFCHHLLVKCPECGENEPIYLGVVEIRNNAVYKICNFDKRKYVKSFPTLDYWLSVIPVMPLIRETVTRFCCTLLPDYLGKYQDRLIQPPKESSGNQLATENRLKGKSTRRGTRAYKSTDFDAILREQGKSAQLLGGLALDGAIGFADTQRTGSAGLKKQALLGASVPDARQELRKNRIEVAEVIQYDPDQATDNVAKYAGTPQRIKPGTRVTLVEKDGKVLYYSIADKPPAAVDIGASRTELDALEKKRDKVAKEVAAIETRVAELTTLREEEETRLGALEARREAVKATLAAMDANLAVMDADLQRMDTLRQELHLGIARDRPVSDLTEVDPDLDRLLREKGIRTLAELAATRPDSLADSTDMDRDDADKLVAAAKQQIKQAKDR